MKASECMTTDVMTCKAADKLADCATMMKEINVGAIPIVDDMGGLRGIITDRDITVRAVSQGVDLDVAQVGDYMTPSPITVEPDTSVEDVAELMAANQVRRLPVVEDARLVGIVSLGDLAVDVGEPEMIEECLERISEPVR